MMRHGYNVNDDVYAINQNKSVPIVAIGKQSNRKLRLF